jgi:hypothetical protein
MSDATIQSPIYGIHCDGPGCMEQYVSETPMGQMSCALARMEASKAGWDVPPTDGKGRWRMDFCPKCAQARKGGPQ